MFRSKRIVDVATTTDGKSKFVTVGVKNAVPETRGTNVAGAVVSKRDSAMRETQKPQFETATEKKVVTTDTGIKYIEKANASPTSMTTTSISSANMLGDVMSEFTETNNDSRGMLTQNFSLNRIYRDIYYRDSVGGSVVDLRSVMPFSDFSLTGIRDEKAADKFVEATERMNIRSLLPSISVSYDVLGAFVASLSWDEDRNTYNGISPQNLDNIQFTPVPVYGADPLMNLKIDERTSMYLQSTDSRMERYKKYIPDDLRNALSTDSTSVKERQRTSNGGSVQGIPLSPDHTIFIPRRGLLQDYMGTSLYRRMLPAWLTEKALIRGMLDQVYKRQRAVSHIIVGDTEWIPTQAEMSAIAQLFLDADLDPVGAMVVTRNGVQVNDVRRGDDFYKWCLTGDTLIPTVEYGLIRIDKLVEEKGKEFSTLGGEGIAPSRDTWYSGMKPVYEMTTNHGNRIRATSKHGFLVLQDDLSLEWKPLGKLSIDDTLCLSSKEIHRGTELSLSPEFTVYGNEKNISVPVKMTPELGYLLGLLLSEGQFDKYVTRFGNTDQRINAKYKKLIKSVFDIDVTFSVQEGSGYSEHTGKRFYASYIGSKFLCEFLTYLGLKNKSSDERSISHHKEIPWSILEADIESQKAFLAAYIDGDGHVNNRLISVYSVSKTILYQMQVLFATFGIMSRVSFRGKKGCLTLNKESAYRAYALLNPYLIDKAKMKEPLWPNGTGMPTKAITDLIKSRRVAGKIATYFDDAGREVRIDGNAVNRDFRKTWIVSHFKQGYYDHLLEVIKTISKSMHAKVLDLFNREYDFAQVRKIEYLGYQPTYDISMSKAHEPSFTANGIVVHNTDAYDQLSTIKFRAIGTSEAFLTGEASYSTIEQTLSVFTEQIRNHRATITNEVFYQKIFPSIAKANSITAKRNRIRETAGLNRNAFYDDNGNFIVEIGASRPTLLDYNPVDYAIPRVQWHKRLMPEADREYLDLLNELTAKGVPVPVRMIAAAGGVDVRTLLEGREDDILLRKQLKEYRDKIKQIDPPPAGEGEGDIEGASATGIGRRNFMSRDFNRFKEPVNFDSKGKRRLGTAKGKAVLDERVNKRVAEAAASLAVRENAREVATNGHDRKRTYSFTKKKA